MTRKFIELSRADVDALIIGVLRRKHRGALPISIEYDLVVDASLAICWYVPAKDGASVHPKFARKPIPQKRAKARKGPMRCKPYRIWVSHQRCAISTAFSHIWCGKSDPAHTQNNGMRSKGPDSSCVPLCRKHHQEYDANRAAFEKKYGVNMKALAAEHYLRYLSETGASR